MNNYIAQQNDFDMPDNENYVKILFRFYSNILDEETVETMWATVIDEKMGHYKLDNIPFYAPAVASDDVVFAEYDEDEERLTYRETVEHSGNSTVHVVMMDKTIDKQIIRKLFEDLGCPSEGMNEGYFAMEVPAAIDYTLVYKKLQELSAKGTIDYAESCLSDIHSTQY